MREFHALLVAMDATRVGGQRDQWALCWRHGGMEVAVFSGQCVGVSSAQFRVSGDQSRTAACRQGESNEPTQVLRCARHRRIILSGELFDAQHAVDIGLVDELVTDPGELIPVAVATARTAGSKSSVLYSALKSSVNDADDVRDEASLNAH